MTTGAIYARFEFAGERVYEVKLPGGVRASENVGKLKQETMKFMGEYLQQHNMTAEEVDLMEEGASEEEEEGDGKGVKARKRKR